MHSRTLVAAVLGAALLVPGTAFANGIAFASLNGFNEVPSLSTDASGSFIATRTGEEEIQFTLDYENVSDFTAVAHIHLGQRHTNGGLLVFLCNNTPEGPQPQPCPQGSGTVEGTITPADVIGPEAQGLQPGDFDALLEALRARSTYVNVHSSLFPAGEIRGQILSFGF